MVIFRIDEGWFRQNPEPVHATDYTKYKPESLYGCPKDIKLEHVMYQHRLELAVGIHCLQNSILLIQFNDFKIHFLHVGYDTQYPLLENGPLSCTILTVYSLYFVCWAQVNFQTLCSFPFKDLEALPPRIAWRSSGISNGSCPQGYASVKAPYMPF